MNSLSRLFMFLVSLFVVGVLPSANAAQPALRICGGIQDGRYYQTAGDIAVRVRDVIRAEVLPPTQGSMDNLQKLSAGECDAALAQADALIVQSHRDANFRVNIEAPVSLYQETAHLLCPVGSNITKLSQLIDRAQEVALLVGSPNGGSAITWDNVAHAVPGLENVATFNIGGQRALTAVSQGAFENGPRQYIPCMFWVGGVGAALIADADKGSGNQMKLVDYLNVDQILAINDRFGRPVYSVTRIPNSVYPGLASRVNNIDTFSVSALFLVRTDWAEAHETEYDTLLRRLRQMTNETPARH